MEHFTSLWWKEYLSFTTSPPAETDIPPNVEQPKQVATSKKKYVELLLNSFVVKGPAKINIEDFRTSLLLWVF